MNMTRNWMILIVLILAMLMLNACNVAEVAEIGTVIRGSGNVVSQEEAIDDFNRLEVNNGFQVDAQQGDEFSVIIRLDDNLVEYLHVVNEGNTLTIGLEPGRSYNIVDATLEADVTMPELAGLDLSGGSHVEINGFNSAVALDANLSGGSHLNGDVVAGDTKIDLSGGSEATLSGSAGNLKVDARGGSHAKLANLAVANADVDASGGSHVTVNASGKLDAEAKGGSHIRYLGNPSMGTIDDDASSTVEQE